MISLWPRTLLGRNILLLLGLMIVVQASTVAASYVFLKPRVNDVAALTAAEIIALDEVLGRIPSAERAAYVQRIGRTSRLYIRRADEGPGPGPGDKWPTYFAARQFLEALREKLPRGTEVVWKQSGTRHVWVRAEIDGTPYWISLPTGAAIRDNALRMVAFAAVLIGTLVLIGAFLIQRRINRPLHRIADGVRQLGAGGYPETLTTDGPVELASLISQFNAMSESLKRMEENRTVMLAGISHDIRTPLTKLRLSLAMQKNRDAEQEALNETYFRQIDAIVQQFMDFGQSATGEAPIIGDINTLVIQLAAEFDDRGHPFELQLDELPQCAYRPIALLRALRNLMDNAVKYGRHGLALRTQALPGRIGIAVLDRGPGIPPADRKRLLQPFVRSEEARSTSGTGLGLAIVERIVAMHGGEFELRSREQGGLCAQMWLSARAT